MITSIPVEPDAPTGREWAREELEKVDYQDQGTSWLLQFFDWLDELLAGVEVPGVGGIDLVTVAVILLIIAAVGVLVWWLLGPMRRTRRSAQSTGVLEDDARSSSQLLSSARRWASQEDWAPALLDMYRALVKRLDERGVLDARPGMTAYEAAVDAGTAFPDSSARVRRDADMFDAVRYGHRDATRGDYEHAQTTFDALNARRVVESA